MKWLIILIGLGSCVMIFKSKKIRKKWRRFNAYLSLSDQQYSRLQMILKSDCDIPGVIRYVSGRDKPAPETGQVRSVAAHTSTQIASWWYEENHKQLEKTVYRLCAEEKYDCEIGQYSRLPEYSHWRQLAAILQNEWNVSCYWNADSFYISWKQK